MIPDALRSIYDLEPLEIGGVLARKGFSYQDEIAVGFCLEMAASEELAEVWCESQDDITLLWGSGADMSVEFVQVKSWDLQQLWTIALLCKRGSDGEPSVLEKSLQYDRCREPVRFRLVTDYPVKTELDFLTLPLGHPDRAPEGQAFRDAAARVRRKVRDYKSPNGHDCEFWLANAVWDENRSWEAARIGNRDRLRLLAEAAGQVLTHEQTIAIHEDILREVSEAAAADPTRERPRKRLAREPFKDRLQQRIYRVVNDAGAAPNQKLTDKLDAARIPPEEIQAAISIRRRYRREVLQPRYQDSANRAIVEGEIEAALQLLRARLDAGEIVDDGVAFHAQCLEMLERLRLEPQFDPPPTRAFVHGFMYDIAARCYHRFRRLVTP